MAKIYKKVKLTEKYLQQRPIWDGLVGKTGVLYGIKHSNWYRWRLYDKPGGRYLGRVWDSADNINEFKDKLQVVIVDE